MNGPLSLCPRKCIPLLVWMLACASGSLALAEPISSASVSGGSFTAPDEQGVFDNGHGFGVYGDFSVQATGGADVVVSIDTSLDFPELAAGFYQTGTFILGNFSSSHPNSTASLVTFFAYSYVDGVFPASLSGAGFQNENPGIPMYPGAEVTSGGTSGVFFLAGGNYSLLQHTEVRITGAAADEILTFTLPDPRVVVIASVDSFLDPAAVPTPEPASLTLLALGCVSFAGGGLWTRRRSLASA